MDCSLLKLFCPLDFSGKNTGMSYHLLLQRRHLDPGIEAASPVLAGGSLPLCHLRPMHLSKGPSIQNTEVPHPVFILNSFWLHRRWAKAVGYDLNLVELFGKPTFFGFLLCSQLAFSLNRISQIHDSICVKIDKSYIII